MFVLVQEESWNSRRVTTVLFGLWGGVSDSHKREVGRRETGSPETVGSRRTGTGQGKVMSQNCEVYETTDLVGERREGDRE